jgi:DNA-binding CsgD family transcriptional regulator
MGAAKSTPSRHRDIALEISRIIPRAKSGEKMVSVLETFAKDLGFEYCSYTLCTLFPIGKPRVAIFSNYPAELHNASLMQSATQNPLLQHGMRTSGALVWSHRIFASNLEFWQTARKYGFCHGWTQSAFSSNSIAGILTVARGTGRITSSELRIKSMVICWLAHLVHQSLSKHMMVGLMPELNTRLTKQEKAVLRGTCDDKSSRQIADDMRIAERTVNFHVHNALVKLNVTSRAAASVRAALLGLLD